MSSQSTSCATGLSRLAVIVLCAAALSACTANQPGSPQSGTTSTSTSVQPPAILREFRAAWIPTVGNSCWPSKPGLTTAQQKAELIALLDRAAELKLNAVIFQIRPACDALYRSDIEPWSEYLTGVQGKAPSPYYDPLEFAVAEAHRRGLELHAWFNPFRARHMNAKSPVSANHVSRARPALVRKYGNYLWLDPGDPAVQDYSLKVVTDVVRRYDLDAVHFDDYFYPYPEKNAQGMEVDFPDGETWAKHGTPSGLSRADWRRRNVDQFLSRVATAIKAEKPHVKFGLSPFGIWRPKHPPGIAGFDAYEKLYADARKWLVDGTCDYLAPQLYWAIDPPAQSYPALLKWWAENNPKGRHLWPGINSLKVGPGTNEWKASEIVRQIALSRQLTPGAPGQIHWSHSALMKNASLQQALATESYRQPALPPAYPWLDATAPARPSVKLATSNRTATVTWLPGDAEPPARWVVQVRQFGDWKTHILPGSRNSMAFESVPDAVAVTAVDRCGNTSSAAILPVRPKLN